MLGFWALPGTSFLRAESPDTPLMRDFIGLNGHFGFKPELYSQVCRLVRNYHNINWDVAKPGDPITVPKCPNGVDWETHVYGPWAKHGFEVDVCVQFGKFGKENEDLLALWEGREEWIRRYGYELAAYFGPSGPRKQMTSIEIGNEPGKAFDDELYRRLFMHMAKGIREADPALKIVTATAKVGEADAYAKSLEETFDGPDIKPLYDVINVHTYAVKPKGTGRSPWDRSYPEDPSLQYLRKVDEVIDFRNRRAPGKEVWVTKFGYDACTEEAMTRRKGWAKKLDWRGVSDTQQARYLVRSLFCFAERDVERAYIYFYNDKDEASVHAASGLTRHFKPKPSFWAIKHLYETLGDYRWNRIVRKEQGDVYVYEFRHGSEAGRICWVAWSPTGSEREIRVTLPESPGRLVRAERMPLTEHGAEKVKVTEKEHELELVVSESPVYLMFKNE